MDMTTQNLSSALRREVELIEQLAIALDNLAYKDNQINILQGRIDSLLAQLEQQKQNEIDKKLRNIKKNIKTT